MRFLALYVLITLGTSFSAFAQERVFYPSEAQAQGIGGRVTLECLVEDDGRLACEVVEESPADMAFGAAALRMSQEWRVAPRTSDGVATTGGRIRRTLVFDPGPPARVVHDSLTGLRRVERPSAQDFARLYPRRARNQGISGYATISCVVNDSYGLNCEVEAENPPEMGFGEATLQIAQKFRVAPLTDGGEPTIGQRIRRTIRWEMP